MEVDVEDGRRVVAVRGDRNDPLFEGYTCIKGRQLADQHHDPGRLRAALRRAPEPRRKEEAQEKTRKLACQQKRTFQASPGESKKKQRKPKVGTWWLRIT